MMQPGAEPGDAAPGEEQSERLRASPTGPHPAAKRACPANSEGSGPDRSHHTPARTMPSSWVVSMTEKARP